MAEGKINEAGDAAGDPDGEVGACVSDIDLEDDEVTADDELPAATGGVEEQAG